MFAPRVAAFLSALALSMTATAVPTAAVPKSTTFASVVKPNEFDIYNPPITAPAAGDIWAVGSSQVVQWDVSKIGNSGRNTTANVYLGHQFPDGSEYLDISMFSISVLDSLFC